MSPPRKQNIAPWSLVVFLAVAAVVGGLFWSPDSAVHADAETGTEPEVVAVVGDAEITRSELEESLSGQLRDLDRQRYQLLEEGLEQVIAERLVQIEAEGLGLEAEEYLEQQVAANVAEPSEAEVDTFYESRKDQIGQTKEQIAPQIRTYLKQQSSEDLYSALIETLRVTPERDRARCVP